jgi:hypothetical protein
VPRIAEERLNAGISQARTLDFVKEDEDMDSDNETLQQHVEMSVDCSWRHSLGRIDDWKSHSEDGSDSSARGGDADHDGEYADHDTGHKIEHYQNEKPNDMDPKLWKPTIDDDFESLMDARATVESWAAHEGFKVRTNRSKMDNRSPSRKCMFSIKITGSTTYSVRCH